MIAEMKQWLTKNPASSLNCFCFCLVYSKGKRCNVHVSIEENVYLIINVSLVQWYNLCKSTSYRFLSQNSSCSFCYCNFYTSASQRKASLLWLIWGNSTADWKNSLVGQLVGARQTG